MSTSTFRIRFVPVKTPGFAQDLNHPHENDSMPTAASSAPGSVSAQPGVQTLQLRGLRRPKSKNGCKECKLRRVKCDETFPVCLRCQRRGSLCESTPRLAHWQTEMPELDNHVLNVWSGRVTPNKRLVQHWMEKTSQMLCLKTENNPLSFPLLQYLVSSPSLVHAVQSISAGHEHYFSQANLGTCLKERGHALASVREQLQMGNTLSMPNLLTIFLLGISSPWTESRPASFAKEHLMGALAALDAVLSDQQKSQDPLAQYMLGWYLYWDMTCSFIAAPNEIMTLNTPQIYKAIQKSRGSFHPMAGFSMELYYLLACVGRHCRRVLDYGEHDPILEITFGTELLAWNPIHEDQDLVNLSLAYRNHGLIMLYKICGRHTEEDGEAFLSYTTDTDFLVRSYALDTLNLLSNAPSSTPCFNFQSLPLLTAGAELNYKEEHLRLEVIERFRALYSSSRVTVNLLAISFLKEIWLLRDSGRTLFWPELLKQKEWMLCFA